MLKEEKIRNAILIGGTCSLSYFAVYFARNILSAVTPQLIEQGVFTTEFIGSVSSVYFVCYAVGQLINGAVGDKIKSRYMISLGLALAGICNFSFVSFTDSPVTARVIYGMTGFFLSMIYGPMTKVVAENTDDLLTVLRAFKQRGEDIIPIGGCANRNAPTVYLLNAFGYNTTDNNGASACIRDGKVVLPIADREAYGAYLEFMNTLYSEGLIHLDYFTMDRNTSDALVSAGKVGFISQAPLTFMNNFSSWWGAKPLTSDYNEEAFWPASTNSLNCGNFKVA